MIVYSDSRQKPIQNSHITMSLVEQGYEVVRQKLDVGDYMFPDSKISVDTKQDMLEVYSNVVQDHKRFARECQRAKDSGIKLVVLIADDQITQLADVFTWKNPRRFYSKKALPGKTVAKIMFSMQEKYGVEFQFATKDEIGNRVIEILKSEVVD